MMHSGYYPAAVLFIEAPHSEVDVNVHPAKTEVRFLHEGAVLAFVRDSVSSALRSTHPITQVPGVARANRDTIEEPRSWGVEGQRSIADANQSSRIRQRDVVDSLKDLGSDASIVSASKEVTQQRPAWLDRNDDVQLDRIAIDSPQECKVESPAAVALVSQTSSPEANTLPGFGHGIKPLGQIRDSYIVATDEEGLLLVDQHVAHERILFEQFRDARLARSSGLQPLLIPATLDLTPAEVEAFSIVQGELENIGIETMQLSGRTIAIKTAPAGLSSSDVLAVVRELLAVIERERRSFTIERIRDEIAAELACKAAIKINMPLTPEKMQWLIDELMKTQNPMTCPHGRPILMRMGLRDIERGFKRPV